MKTYEALLDAELRLAIHEGGMHFQGQSEVQKTLRRLAGRLDEARIEYALAGALAMFMHGYRRFTEVIDVLVTAESLARIHDELDGRGYVRVFEKSKNLRDAESRVRIDFLVTGQFPGDGRPSPIAFPDPKDVAELRDGLRVVSLPTLVQLKLASGQAPGRLKDLGDAQEFIKVLQLPAKFAEQLHPGVRNAYLDLWRGAQTAPPDET